MPASRRFTIAAITLVVFAVALIGYFRWRQQHEGDTYQATVSAFYSGVLALDADDPQHDAAGFFLQATQLSPQEPAAWADLGVYYLRRGNFDQARQDLEKARALAPDNAPIEALLGLLEQRQGNFDQAVAHLERAVQIDPADLRTRDALVQALEQQAGPDSAAEAERQRAAMFQTAPDNLFVIFDVAEAAARAGDAPSLRQAVTRLVMHRAGWPPEAEQDLTTLRTAAAGSDAREALAPLIGLRHQVEPLPAYQQDMALVQLPEATVGMPLEQFVVLPVPSPLPAPPDMALRFAPQALPLSSGTESWDIARVFSPTPELVKEVADKFSLPVTLEGPPATLLANGREVRIIPHGGTSMTLPFPGGPQSVPPGPDGVLLTDFSYDFKPGLVLAGAGGVRLYRQSPRASAASPAFADVTAMTKLPPAVLNGAYTGAWSADIDMDGDLDILLGARSGPPTVLRNNGDGTFDVLHPFPGKIDGLSAFAWGDFDGDGVPDAALIDGHGRLFAFENARAGQFRAWPLPATLGKVAALSIADASRRGTMDLITLGTDGTVRRLSRRAVSLPGEPDAGWDLAQLAHWPATPSDGSARLRWADLDNNGAQDLIATGSGGSQVWLSDVQGSLIPLPGRVDGHDLSTDDTDDQGRLDLIGISPTGQPERLANQGSKDYGWQILRPRADQVQVDRSGPQTAATGDKRINSFGIGGEMELRAGLLYEKLPITGPTLHFGLGTRKRADLVRITWPNGSNNGEFALSADQAEVAPQRLKGSCPWLFADDGHGLKFVTDLIWRSPLGLRINAQATAGVVQTQDWVKIRGDQLAARDGFYNLSITAELWETHFFDHVALMTVDHPVGTDVFVDERFAIPPPALALHAMTTPRPVARAWDDRGQDVTAIVRARDGRYLDTFGRGAYQGVTRDHWVEVDLGRDAPTNKPLWLVAQGWIHPTDSSINVALSQGRHDPPRDLSLEVPDAKGGWTIVRPHLGFPEGKNKTILIKLTGLPHRLRLRTNMEIYWDFLGYATALPQTPLRTQRHAASTATLRYRGFSVTHQANASSPEIPDYDALSGTGPRWLDLTGYYTRYGDVRELLARTDDRYVIMNAGDEMRLRFPAPPPPPPGWTRDYVMMADGWEKDGDFNTDFSQTVLPLPSHDRPGYNTPPGRLEDDPVYQRHESDWTTYQTRYVTARPYRDALIPPR